MPELDSGDLHVGTVVVNVTDMDRAVSFWSQVLGYRTRDANVDPEFTTLVDPARRGPAISLQAADEIPADPAPVHLDLYTRERDKHVDRLVGLGATVVDEWPYPDRHDFIVLRDPDGNEFCVIAHQD
jgi:catechol 2,3-dioxygenase-like lactoylglutathione lyase family enzyme